MAAKKTGESGAKSTGRRPGTVSRTGPDTTTAAATGREPGSKEVVIGIVEGPIVRGPMIWKF